MNYFSLKTRSLVYIDELRQSSIPFDTSADILEFKPIFDVLVAKCYRGFKGEPTHFIEPAWVSSGFFINTEVKNIFEKFVLPPHEYYKLEVEFRSKKYPYWWFRLLKSPMKQVVNLHKTIFLDEEGGKPMQLPMEEIMSNEHPFTYACSLGYLSTLAINNEYTQYDMLNIHGWGREHLISEALKATLMQQKIKGMAIEDFIVPIQYV